MCGLLSTTHSDLLTPESNPVPQPRNDNQLIRPPTKLETEKLNPRSSYSKTFDLFPFSGTTKHLPISATKKVSLFICFSVPQKYSHSKIFHHSPPNVITKLLPTAAIKKVSPANPEKGEARFSFRTILIALTTKHFIFPRRPVQRFFAQLRIQKR